MTDRWAFTIPEAARAIGVSESHAYRLAKAGVLPTIKLGRRRVVPIKQFNEWASEHLEAS